MSPVPKLDDLESRKGVKSGRPPLIIMGKSSSFNGVQHGVPSQGRSYKCNYDHEKGDGETEGGGAVRSSTQERPSDIF